MPGSDGIYLDIGLALGDLSLSVELAVAPGEVLALLGPNGAGKSSLLRCLAGLQPIGRGHVVISGEVVDDPAAGVFTEADRRSVGMLFQDYLLFPHLDVLDNVAFGPRSRGMRRAAARGIARRWIERMNLVDHVGVRPGELSGGQAQRVALARALATDPELLLLDEPLAALDATTRSTVRRDLHAHLDEFAGTAIIVSHDPLDALALADRVAVLEQGKLTQVGSLGEVTSRPRTRYVADLVGVNLLHGDATDHTVTIAGDDGTTGDAGEVHLADPMNGSVLLLIRPRAVALHRRRPDTSARNVWRCTVEGFDMLGEHVQVRLRGAVALTAEVTPGAVAELGVTEGSEVWASVKATEVDAYPQ